MNFPHLRRTSILALACLAAVVSSGSPVAAAESLQPAWGQISQDTNGTGLFSAEVRSWPKHGKLALPASLPEVVAAYLSKGEQGYWPAGQRREPLPWTFDASTAQAQL